MCLGCSTSAVVARSCAGSCAALTLTTRVTTLSVLPEPSELSAISALATRSPMPVPVASMTVMWRRLLEAPRDAMYIGIASAATASAGTASVPRMNQRERTRSMYSRFATAINLLSMSGQPLFDASRADALQEDLMQRRPHQLEALDVRARLDEPAQQHLRIGGRRQLQLEKVVVLVQLADQRRVAQHAPHAVVRAARERERDVA